MSEPRWSIQAPREEGAPFLLYGGVMVGRLYGGAPVSEMLRLLNAEDADTLRQIRERLRDIRNSWEIAPGAPLPGYEFAIHDIDGLLAEIEPVPDTGAEP